MKFDRIAFVGMLTVSITVPLLGQTPALSSIEAPYAGIPTTVHMAGGVYGPGSVAYGPAGTPLVLNGSDFGDSGTVEFIAYKNGVVDTNDSPVHATAVTLWTSTLLLVKVPSGALTGLVKVVSTGGTSNGIPFVVVNGSYNSNSCPALPPQSQLQITTSALDDGMVGQPYSATLSAEGGTAPYSWSIVGNPALPAGISLNASTGAISGTPTATVNQIELTVQATDSSSSHLAVTAELSLTIAGSSKPSVIYSYSIPSYVSGQQATGYDATGNNVGYTDSVTGSWSYSYDTLNRMTSGTPSSTSDPAPYAGLQVNWTYDGFGNRTEEYFSGTLLSSDYGAIPPSTSATYNSNNRIATVGSGTVPVPDASGNITTDTQNQQYLYDAEGRICAFSGLGGTFGYLYDAEGTRVAKGIINSLSCTATNGFTLTESYILSPGNEQLTELDWSGSSVSNWHTNVWAGGQLAGTYSNNLDPETQAAQPVIINFHLTDWLGSRRVTTDFEGTTSATCLSLPYGNGETCTPTPTEHLFTGKERDTESGNDYFGARYYASSMGRFMSPDWSAKVEPVPYAKLDDPQSLNLYAYMSNNPLGGVDADGHWGCQGSQEGFCSPAAQDGMRNGMTPGEALDAAHAAQQQTGVAASCPGCTQKQAALAAEKAALGPTRDSVKSGHYHEYGGWIIKGKDGNYTYTVPLAGSERTVDIDNISVPSGFSSVADYHTHPHVDAAEGEGPSMNDIQRAVDTKRTGYVMDSVSGRVYRYSPTTSTDHYPMGTPIGTVSP